ncbi:hypothetical protein BU25DRAFT_465994 [Macroventuria anomochaeta]|uniref:Uncharacterized protein n=1 Tax=Macroventuria anomochaeta TaxID=301207 RepID=A0ACB6S6W4_9PLEO|nr:uncharacterized protein BU25DRAFT_465994 [Macroventuria anomochaeta]KAF2628959.1 hypothetical protein BU25DRAFT_465994 [Macroventuria anomochaeta]
METTIVLTMFATLAQAGLLPFLPSIEVRDMLQNSTANVYAGQNTTQVDPESMRDYNTTEYRVYIAFLVSGIVMAVAILPVSCSPDILYWYRRKREDKQVRQRKADVEMATAKMRAMAQPDMVYLRPERAG